MIDIAVEAVLQLGNLARIGADAAAQRQSGPAAGKLKLDNDRIAGEPKPWRLDVAGRRNKGKGNETCRVRKLAQCIPAVASLGRCNAER